jgi:nitrous oxidase accessory protein NosD
MAIVTVSDTAHLLSALTAAQSGDVIQLAAGTYAPIKITGLNFAGGVTVTSADSLHPALLTGLTVASSSGLDFSQLELRASDTKTAYAISVSGSQHLQFDRLDIHGSLDNDPTNDSNAILIQSSSDVSVTHSEFQQLATGIGHLDSDHLTFSGNAFHDIRMDGIRGGGSSWVTISGNTFTDFHPASGDHPDAIQFWTTNTTSSAHDIAITDNMYLRGAGSQIQGVFMGDEVGTLPFTHVLIRGNLFAGAMYNGIAVGDGQDVTVADNIVQGFTDMKSWIYLNGVTSGAISGNAANVVKTSADTTVTIADNTTLHQTADLGAAVLATWVAQHHLLDLPSSVQNSLLGVLRTSVSFPTTIQTALEIKSGMAADMSADTAVATIVKSAAATTSVATLAYEFFTGKAPSASGMDFLVSPTGPNANNLNSSYYQSFSLENRYINFAVNLGKMGDGKAAFTADYGNLSLFEATRTAYAKIFGEAPSDTKLHALLDPTTVLNGQTFTRADYFAYYGGDGANGIGTKAAMVGYLLAEAVKADVGTYALSNDAFLTDVATHGAPFGVDLVGQYSQPAFVFHPG